MHQAQAKKIKLNVAKINLNAPGGEIPGRISNRSMRVIFLAFSAYGAVLKIMPTYTYVALAAEFMSNVVG